MLSCETYLAEYSSLRDGFASRSRREALEAHGAACPSCARYDRVIVRGTQLCRDLPDIEPSPEFMGRLQERLIEVDAEAELQTARARSQGTSIVATGLIAASIALFAWIPALRPVGSMASSSTTEAAKPHLVVVPQPVQTAGAPPRVGGLSTQLAELGVPVLHTPYHDLVFRESPLRGSVATFAVGDLPLPR